MFYKQIAINGDTEVTFVLPCGLWAEKVHLVGEFNGWSETATPMSQTSNGWVVTLRLPRGRQFQYRYLVDRTTWMNDWSADHYVENEYEGYNSVVYT